MANSAVIKIARTVGAETTDFGRAVLVKDIPAPSGTVPVITHSSAPRTGVDLSVDARGLTISARQWYRDGLPIAGETGATYTLLAGDLGKRIFCRCTVSGNPIDTPSLYIPVTRTDATATLDMLDEDSLRQMMVHSAMDHVAIRSGDWGDPTTWDSGTVPAAEDSVLIPFGVEVTYDLTAAIRYDLIRVDGRMRWRRDANTHLLCDTIFGDVGSKISVSDNLGRRILAANTAVIEFRTDTDISLTRDPRLMSRGLISFGLIETFGATKAHAVKTASAPEAGDTSITLASAPAGWAVGDEVFIPTTLRVPGAGPTQDETRIITSISGATISFTTPLVYDHDHHHPSVTRTDLQPHISILTRNVVFRSENGAAAQVHRRGHVMSLREGDFNIWHAAFEDLGRTKKLVDKFTATGQPGEITSGGTFQEFRDTTPSSITPVSPVTLTASANVDRRHPLTCYRTGWDAGNGQRRGKALHYANVTVLRSPGWGVLQSSCLARMWNVVVINVDGAGIVAEHGDETGLWASCGVASSLNGGSGSVKTLEDGGSATRLRNMFASGYGHAMRNRAVKLVDCWASGCDTGLAGWYRHNLYGQTPLGEDTVELSDVISQSTINYAKFPILHWTDLEFYGCKDAMFLTKPGPDQGHEGMNIIRNVLSWAISDYGPGAEYVGWYLWENIDTVCVASAVAGTGVRRGASISANAAQMFFVNLTTEQCAVGIEVSGGLTPYGLGDGEEVARARIEDPRHGVFGHTSTSDGAAWALATGARADEANFTYSATVPMLRDFPTVTNMSGGSVASGVSFEATADVASSLSDFVGGEPISLPHYWNTSTNIGASEAIAVEARSGTWTVGGQRKLVVPRYYADPLTGQFVIAAHIADWDLVGTPFQGDDYGAIAALPATPTHTAPPALAYTVTASAGVTIDFAADLLSQHSYDATGLHLHKGFVGAIRGVNEVRDLGNGTVLYRPAPTVTTGTDEITLFLTDLKGNFYPLLVNITISIT